MEVIKSYAQAVADGSIKEYTVFSLADANKFNANQMYMVDVTKLLDANILEVSQSLTQNVQQLQAADTTLAGEITTLKNKVNAVDIMPNEAGISSIGSPTQKFKSIYTQELYLDANTLYVDGVPVLGSSAETISISADANQGIRVATTGTGQTVLDSQSATTIQTNGTNADVIIQSQGIGSRSRVTSNTEIILTAPSTKVEGNQVVTGDQTINGNLNVMGTTTTINTADMAISDNIIVVNKGELGSGVSANFAGFQVDRGDLTDVRFVFDESTDKWKMGPVGAEKDVASEEYVNTGLAQKANTVHAHAVSDISGLQAELSKFMSSAGIASSSFAAEANKEYIVTANNLTVTLPASPMSGTVISLLDGTGSISSLTLQGNGQNVEGAPSHVIDSPAFASKVVYVSPSYGWRVFGI